jgi:thioredoxin 1
MQNLISIINVSDKPVIVYFWAPWCGTCQSIAPIIEQLSNSYSNKILFTKINIDDNTLIAKSYKIISIPTLILLKNGNILKTMTGLISKKQIIEHINSLICFLKKKMIYFFKVW